ncbi:MAG: hypothetical protein HY043_10590 [Verrucomicrobia bacterium]|nr:hypothetical protein [Verrucomicrobiota bacterium]
MKKKQTKPRTLGAQRDATKVDVVKLALEESMGMVDRFSAEPVFGRTGRGYLKSAGVSELQQLKEEHKPRR